MALPASDSFTGSTATHLESYSSDWAAENGTMEIRFNQCASDAAGHNLYRWTADTFGNDHYAEATYSNNATSARVGVAVRVATGAHTGYYFVGNSTGCEVWKAVTGTTTSLGSSLTGFSVSDNIKLEVSGNQLTAKINDVTVITATDSDISSGAAGVAGVDDASNARIDDWTADDLAASGVTVTAALGALSLSGQSATIAPGAVTIDAALGALDLSGPQATVTTGAITIDVALGALSLSGVTATVTPGAVTVDAALGALDLSGPQATVTPGAVTVDAVLGAVTLGGLQASVSVSSGTTIAASLGSLQLSGLSATIVPGAVTINANLGALSLSGLATTVQNTTTINANLGTLVLSGQQATVTPGAVTIEAALGALLISGLQAAVSASIDSTTPNDRIYAIGNETRVFAILRELRIYAIEE